MWALVVYRTPGESTTRYLVQVEKQLKMVHHYFFLLLTHQIQMFYMLWILEKFLSQIMLFFLGICQSVHKSLSVEINAYK